MRRILLLLFYLCLPSAMAFCQENTYVDLGLSVKWATTNYGADQQSPCGGYYRWNDAIAITNADDSRLGTKAQWNELRENCSWKWTTLDGVQGYLLTSKLKGYTDRSVFLPAAGWRQDGRIEQMSQYAAYWSSTEGVQPGDEAAYGFNFKQGHIEWHSENRASEQSLRMVMPLSDSEITNLDLNEKKVKVPFGSHLRLDATMSNGKRNVNSVCSWSSSDESIVRIVEEGLLVAVAPGICTVTAQAYGRKAACTVTVTDREYEYVDLGLSVLWATCNIGATRPSEFGEYYAWAEIEPKDFFSWNNYKYCSFAGQMNGMDKYTEEGFSHQYLKADGLNRLEPSDDVASVLLGEEWHAPTVQEYEELKNKCNPEIAVVDGIVGLRFTSEVPGYEGRSIFIPLGGYFNGNESVDRGENFYIWSSIGNGMKANCLRMESGLTIDPGYYITRPTEDRFIGMNVRPVRNLFGDQFEYLSLSEERLDLNYGDIRRLSAMMLPVARSLTSNSVEWSSSNPNVAIVLPDGSVTAVGQGSCIIEANSSGKIAHTNVTVTLPHPTPVDLGLSVKWASANIGAASPSHPGGYFAWGETSVKAGVYNYDNYKFDGIGNQWKKYNFGDTYSKKYKLDCKENLDPEDDAAQVLLGGGWRMPSAIELHELREKCTWQEVKAGDSCGILITSNVPGYEGQSIFLPYAGRINEYHYEDEEDEGIVSNNGSYASYWTSTLEQGINANHRYVGQSIRPVMAFSDSERKSEVKPIVQASSAIPEAVDLGLSVKWANLNVGAYSPEQCGSLFAWGETEQKPYYSFYNYKYAAYIEKDNRWWYTKYVPEESSYKESNSDGKMRLDAEDDAASVNLGGNWRLPTKDECNELFEKCDWKDTVVNGIRGYLVTSKVEGFTVNSIFLPCTAGGSNSVISNPSKYNLGRYLTADASSKYTHSFVSFNFSNYSFRILDEIGVTKNTNFNLGTDSRYMSFPVRAVCPVER